MYKKVYGYFTAMMFLICCVCCMNVTARAESYEDFEYEVLEDGTIGITWYDGEADEVVIPSEIEGKRVTELWGGIFSDSAVKVITIPQSITEIDRYAFSGCGLTAIYVQEDNPCYASVEGVLFDKEKKCLLTYPSGRENDSYVIPVGVERIEEYAFEDCAYLQEIVISDSVFYISSSAFWYCGNLKDITIPESVEQIEGMAFVCCDSLTNINVDPQNEYYASEDGNLLNKEKTKFLCYASGKNQAVYSIPETVTEIGESAFFGCSLEEVVLSNKTKIISDYAFNHCIYLEKIRIPDNVQKIGYHAFSNCVRLKEVELKDGITEIGGSVFFECWSLKELKIPGGLEEIDDYAFAYCYLEKVEIADGVKKIGEGAFAECRIKEVVIPKSVVEIGSGAFMSNSLKVTVENSQCVIGKEVEGMTGLQSETLGSSYGVIYGYAGSTAQEYAKKYNRKFVVIEGQPVQDPQKKLPQKGEKLTDSKTKAVYTVTKAGETLEYAGASNKKVSAVTIPQKVTINGVSYQVTSIGKGACKNYKNMKKVTIPASVDKIGKQAFAGCKKLKTITIKTKKLTVKTVGAKAFKGIHKKAVVKVPRAKKKAYKKLLKAKGAGKSVKVK